MNVVVSNVYADDNRGSAALTRAAVRLIRIAFGEEANVQLISVRTNDPVSFRHTRRDLPDVAILQPLIRIGRGPAAGMRAVARSMIPFFMARHRGALSHSFRHVTDADLVVGRGGYVFKSRPGIQACMSLWLTALPLVVAQRARVPTVVLGSAFGPFQGPGRWLAGWILRRASLVMARDPLSAQNVLALGVENSRILQVPDSVFTEEPASRRELEMLAAKFELEERFAVVTMLQQPATQQSRSFVNEMADTVAAILRRGIVDRVLIVAQVHGQQDSDLAASEELLGRVADSRVSLLSADLSVRELIALYSRAEFVLATRLHSAILSLVARTTPFGVAMFGIKTQGLFQSLGLDDFAWSIADFHSDSVMDAISRAWNDHDAITSRIAGIASNQQAASLRSATALRRVLSRSRV